MITASLRSEKITSSFVSGFIVPPVEEVEGRQDLATADVAKRDAEIFASLHTFLSCVNPEAGDGHFSYGQTFSSPTQTPFRRTYPAFLRAACTFARL